MTERRGAYVTFDGGEGSGKSTQVRRFRDRLSIQVVREPGETKAGASIRQILLFGESLTPEAELFLFSADRHNTLRSVTMPTLKAGKSVLSDRSYLSTLAYQCHGGGASLTFARQVTQLATQDQLPDKQVIFDISPEIGFERMLRSNKDIVSDRFEGRERSFHHRVRNGFLLLAKELGSRAIIIDASGSADEIHSQLSSELDDLLIGGVKV